MTEVPEDRLRDLERGAEEREEGLGNLEGDIETAQERAAEHRERASPEAAAGDWQEESTAAHQGDDATEASRSPGSEDGDGDDGARGGGAIADAPVYEAEQVEPAAGEGASHDREDEAAGPAAEVEEDPGGPGDPEDSGG